MLRNPFFRSALAAAVLIVSLSGCGAARQPIETQAALGKVVVYRNGVAYFERRAVVSDGQLKLSVPADRVIVAESGFATRQDLAQVARYGVRCFLVGESLMREENVELATRELLRGPWTPEAE